MRESGSKSDAQPTDSASGATTSAGALSTARHSDAQVTSASSVQVLYERTAILRRDLVSDDDDLFWGEFSDANGLLVHAAPKAGGGEVRTLGVWYDYPSAQTLALGPEHVYWLRNDGDGSVVRAPKQGGEERVYTLPRAAEGKLGLGMLTFADGVVWVASLGCNEVVRVEPTNGATTLFPMRGEPDAGRSSGFVVHAGKAYCGNGTMIHELDPTTGRVSQVVAEQELVGPLTWANGALYFVDNRRVVGNDERLVRWAPGDVRSTDVGPAFAFAAEMVFDEERKSLFWATGYSREIGTIARYTLGETAPVQLLEAQNVMGGITQDSEYLYWLADQSVNRLKKPAQPSSTPTL